MNWRFLAIWLGLFSVTGTLVTIASYSRLPADALSLIISPSAGGLRITQGDYSLNAYLFAILLGLCLLSIVFVIDSIRQYYRDRRAPFSDPNSEAHKTKRLVASLSKDLVKSRSLLETVVDQSGMSSTPMIALHRLDRLHYRYTILPKYHGRIEMTLDLTVSKDMAFWQFWLEADDLAEKIKGPSDLNPVFTLVDPPHPQRVMAFPLRVQPHKLLVALCFVPVLRPGASVRVKVTFEWKGFFTSLKSKKEDSIFWAPQTDDPAHPVTTVVEVISAKGAPQVRCRNAGSTVTGETLEYIPTSRTWEYRSDTDLKGKTFKLALNID